jgi:Tfp pilus assembly major pilin PilA
LSEGKGAIMNNPSRQRGLSMLGFLFVAAVVLVVALLSFRMIPAYIEYFTIQKALDGALADSNDLSTATIRKAMDRRLSADYADAVTAKDVEVTKLGNVVTASVSWEKRLPVVKNISILLEFDASASR